MIKIILINLILYLSYIWNGIYLLIKYLTTKSEESNDVNKFQQILSLPNILPNIHKSLNSLHYNLTILNWNIHYFTDYKNNCTFINQFDYLKEKRPDIICLQEVKCKTFDIVNNQCNNKLKCMAEKLGYYYIHINE